MIFVDTLQYILCLWLMFARSYNWWLWLGERWISDMACYCQAVMELWPHYCNVLWLLQIISSLHMVPAVTFGPAREYTLWSPPGWPGPPGSSGWSSMSGWSQSYSWAWFFTQLCHLYPQSVLCLVLVLLNYILEMVVTGPMWCWATSLLSEGLWTIDK